MKLDNILNAAMRKDSFLIPKEMVIDGSFRSETPGQIAGTINGDVQSKGRVLIHKEGIINGDVYAEELLVYGKINGDVKRCNKINVQSGAVIKGHVNTGEIHIEKDAVIEGLISKSGVQLTINKKPPAEKKDEPLTENTVPGKERHSWF